jgi:hypothetical protein
MSPRVNLSVQIGALLLLAAIRLSSPGWMLVLLAVSTVGPLLLLAPTVLALVTVRRERLAAPVAAPFLASAAFLVVTAALFTDFDDQRSYVPLLSVFGVDGGAVAHTMTLVGGLTTLGFLVALVCAGGGDRDRHANRPDADGRAVETTRRQSIPSDVHTQVPFGHLR